MQFQDDRAGGAGREHDEGAPDQLPARPGYLRYGVLEVDLDDLGRRPPVVVAKGDGDLTDAVDGPGGRRTPLDA